MLAETMAEHSTQSRLERIKVLIKRLESGSDVQARDLEIVLSTKQRKAMTRAWQEQKELRSIKKPASVAKYEKLLHQAVLWHGKLDRFSSYKPKSATVIVDRAAKTAEIKNKCDRAFEDAFEHLQEIFAADPTVQIWFDRALDFSFETQLGIDPESMPRVITSRSPDNMGDVKATFGQKSKREIKLEALRAAMAELEFELLGDKEKVEKKKQDVEMAKQLKSKLAKLKAMD